MQNNLRNTARQAFLSQYRPGVKSTAMGADASNRRYFRLQGERPELLMDSPPDLEPLVPFLEVASHLISLGLSAPTIYDVDEEHGFALIEDFGDQTFTRLLAEGHNERELYELATDALVTLHKHDKACDISLPAHDTSVMIDTAMLIADWYLPLVLETPLDAVFIQTLCRHWEEALNQVGSRREVLVLRDYHVDNNMLLDDRDGIARCGLLDFQDASLGSRCYDLMSLVEDSRRDISDSLRLDMIERYCSQSNGLNHQHFENDYAALSALRHARIAGIFCRLCLRDGKQQYFAHLPRVLSLLSRALDHYSLQSLKNLFDQRIPKWRDGVSLETALRLKHLIIPATPRS